MYTIECSEGQLKLILEALDFYGRVGGLRQVDEVTRQWVADADVTDPLFADRRHDAQEHLNAAKLAMSGLAPNESFGIFAKEIGDRFRVAYDMQQVIRKAIYDVKESRQPNEFARFTVDAQPLYPTSKSAPITITYITHATDSGTGSVPR